MNTIISARHIARECLKTLHHTKRPSSNKRVYFTITVPAEHLSWSLDRFVQEYIVWELVYWFLDMEETAQPMPTFRESYGDFEVGVTQTNEEQMSIFMMRIDINYTAKGNI